MHGVWHFWSLRCVHHVLRHAPAAAVLAWLAVAAPARADILATFDNATSGPRQVKAVNATTGVEVQVPAGVDDPQASEFHPSLSPDGRYLVFERQIAGTVRVVMLERATGRSADLFSGFEAAADPPNTPTFSRDGTKVLTGRRLDRLDNSLPPGLVQSSFTETDVTNFPIGPFPHRIVAAGGVDSDRAGRTLQAEPFGSGLIAFGIEYDGDSPAGRVIVQGTDGATTLAASTRRFGHPAISESAGVVVFEQAKFFSPFLDTKLVFRPLGGIATAATTELPPLVNASGTTVQTPTFTRDGRYLAFIRRAAVGRPRLYVWDTQTQLLVNPDGVEVVFGPHNRLGGLALASTPVIAGAGLRVGSFSFALAQPSSAGILVQRIVGRHELLGRTAPKLKKVGRVPLGTFRKGRHRKNWNLTVRGRGLRPGCYLVTLRALTRKRRVRDLSTPLTVRIRKSRPPRVRKGIQLRACRSARR